MDNSYIDAALSDPGFFVDHDPHPLWKQLRENDPDPLDRRFGETVLVDHAL